MTTTFALKNIAIATLVSAATFATAAYADDIELVDLATVQPIVISDGNATVISQAEQLTLTAVPTKKSYQVNEAIRFNLVTNQDAYVYMLSTEPNGQTVMVYPNQVDKSNYLQGNMQQMLPSANAYNAPLYSDRAGQESFTIIASTQPLDIPDLFNVVNSGHMTASTDDVKSILAEHGIDIGSDGSTANPNIAVQKINLNITNGMVKVESPDTLSNRAMPSVVASTRFGNTLILSTDKQSYQANEPVTVTYAATGRNYINIGIRSQDGSLKTLKTHRSDSKLKQIRFYMPKDMDSLMLWESQNRNTKVLPVPSESVYLDLNGN